MTQVQDSQELVERAGNARINLKHLSANLGFSEDADVLDAGADAIEALLTDLSTPFPRIVELEARIAELEGENEKLTIAVDDYWLKFEQFKRDYPAEALSTAEARGLERAAAFIESWRETDDPSFSAAAQHSIRVRNSIINDLARGIRALSTNEAGE